MFLKYISQWTQDAKFSLLMRSQGVSCIRAYAALPIFYVESLGIQIGALPMSEYLLAETAAWGYLGIEIKM